MNEKKSLLSGHGSQGQTGYQGYPGGTPAGAYPPGGAPAGAHAPGGAPPQGYPQGGPPPQQQGYPQTSGYQGAPAGAYPGGAPQQGYPGGQPQQGYPPANPPQGYPAGAPAGSYPGGAPQGQGGYPSGAPAATGDVQVQWKGEMPEQDVDDNPNAVPSAPSAPPLEKMDEVTGYGNVGFEAAPLPPPSYNEAMRGQAPQRAEISGLPKMQEEEVRGALLGHVAENCCYGKGAAEQLKFTDLQHSSAFHYTLETYGEGRSTCWAYSPYSGQPLDGPQNGPAPGPWDIQAAPPTMFQDSKSELEVPHTASVKPCHNCMAMGKIRCHRCYGRGRVRCTFCSGCGHRTVYRNGEQEEERCNFCHGDGRRRCTLCNGVGMVVCNCCQGHCQLKCFIKLTILWKNHLTDHIVERTALPDALIRNVTGQVAFEEQNPRVWPVNHFPDAEINTASQRLVQQHASAFPSEKLLMQRHRVRIIPVTQAFYKWKDNNDDFFVYGFENRVYAPSYPQQCCCGCSII